MTNRFTPDQYEAIADRLDRMYGDFDPKFTASQMLRQAAADAIREGEPVAYLAETIGGGLTIVSKKWFYGTEGKSVRAFPVYAAPQAQPAAEVITTDMATAMHELGISLSTYTSIERVAKRIAKDRAESLKSKEPKP